MRRLVALGWAVTLAVAGCGGSANKTESNANPTPGQIPPGKVEKAARSNPHKEIPTRFKRTVQLPYKNTVLYVTALRALDPLPAKASGTDGKRLVGVVVGIRNVGHTGWSGVLADLSRLAVSDKDSPKGVVGAANSSAGPCPAALVQSRAPVNNKPMSVAPGRSAFACVRFLVPRREHPILYKFAPTHADFTAYPLGPSGGNGYGVWALPGTLVEKCRFEPSQVKGHCHGLEVAEE